MGSDSNKNPPLLTTGQVASLFGVNFKTILRWAQSGLLAHSRLPGNRGDYRFSRSAITEFAQTHQLPLLPDGGHPERANVLVIDDDPAIGKSIERILRRVCTLWLAEDSYQAGVLMALKRPTLVFLDLQMPGIHGESLLKYMKATPELKDIPVCIVSGAPRADLDRALSLGAVAAIEKPFDAEMIRSTAAQIIFKESKKTLFNEDSSERKKAA